jgi:hypothetical protein
MEHRTANARHQHAWRQRQRQRIVALESQARALRNENAALREYITELGGDETYVSGHDEGD